MSKELITVEQRVLDARNKLEKYQTEDALVFVSEEDMDTQRIFIPEIVMLKATADDFHDISGSMMPKSYHTDRIAEASGISFVPGECGTRKDGPDTWVGFAQGRKRQTDGSWRLSNVQEYEFDVAVRSEEDFLKSRSDKYKSEIARKQHILELRKFARQRASTGARLRVIRELAKIPIGFKKNEILKAMVFCRIAVNTDRLLENPATQEIALAHAIGAQREIFGATAHVEDVAEGEPVEQIEEAVPAAFPEDESEAEPELSPEDHARLKLEEWLKSDVLTEPQRKFVQGVLDNKRATLEELINTGLHCQKQADKKKEAKK